MSSIVYYIETKNKEPLKSVSGKMDRLIKASDILKHVEKDHFTSIKMHFGEEGDTGYINPDLVKRVAYHISSKTKNSFLTDTNVLYKESFRTNTVGHLRLASRHGFSLNDTGIPVIIADGLLGTDFVEIGIEGKFFSKVKIASAIARSDSIVALTHVTGHIQTGLAGAIKNIGMGCASRLGKYEQHAGVVPEINTMLCIGCGLCQQQCPASCITMESKKARIARQSCIGCGECVVACRTRAIDTPWNEALENLQKKMVEYCMGVRKAVKGKVCYINFLLNVTEMCDCMAKADPRIVSDRGMLASFDPVSIDKASADLLIESHGNDIFNERHPLIDWSAQLRYASEMGLGDLNYRLEKIEV